MSSTNRGAERVVNDAYQTPLPVARALVGLLPIGSVGWTAPLLPPLGPAISVLEPHVGGGAFVTAIREHAITRGMAVSVIGNDIDPAAPGFALCDHAFRGDFLAPGWKASADGFDLVVGNPPFTGAEAHVRRALEVVRPGGHVAFLLLLSFLESAKRVPFWREFPPRKVWTLVSRPRFNEVKGVDQRAYGWFLWERGWGGTPELGWIDWRARVLLVAER